MSTSFYKRSRPRPDGTVGYSGYDHADTIADAVTAYKRTRKTQYFILTDDSPDLDKVRCTCGALLSEPDPDGKVGPKAGNRCQFIKRDGVAVRHGPALRLLVEHAAQRHGHGIDRG